MANEISKTPTQAKLQVIPLSKIHDLPNVFIAKPQDKSLGSMVLSIESSGVKEPVILRQRDDGEYQLLSGYRRRRASELAKKPDIPAHVYEMTMQEAIAYRKAVKNNPNAPIPGKLLEPVPDKDMTKSAEAPAAPGDKTKEDKSPAAPGEMPKDDKTPAAPGEKPKEDKAPAAPGEKPKDDKTPAVPGDKTKNDKTPAAPGEKPKEDKAPAAPGEKPKEDKAPAAPGEKPKEDKAPAAPGDTPKEDKAPAAPGDTPKEDKAPAAPGEKPKEDKAPAAPGEKPKEDKAPAAPGEKPKEDKAPAAPGDTPKEDKTPAAPGEKDTPTVAELEAQAKSGQPISLTDLANADKAEREAQKGGTAETDPPGQDKGEALTAAKEGPAGTAITQIFEKRLTTPDEAARKTLPTPKEGESYFITLHPAYLEKSSYNNFSVDVESENFKELLKSIELVGIKDPVLARFNEKGGLEILSGQRRHIAATMLNQAVPTIIQKIGDADAKIIVADGNLHRDKISSYDLSRALRMKMEGMKQKAGRRKKGFSANELQSDAKLAQEMGMTVSKLNRLIRMSEAIKGVCDLVDEGKLSISTAAEMSALKPKTQESVLHLLDLGYKTTTDRIIRMKKAEGEGKKLDEMELRKILDDKDIAPKQPEPVQQPEAPTTGAAPEPAGEPAPQPPIPASPDVPQTPDTPPAADIPPWEEPEKAPAPEQGAEPPAHDAPAPERDDDPFKGTQERPEVTKVILTGDRLRKYFPDVSMTPREIEESVYSALEERRQRQMKEQQKAAIFKKSGPTR
ncbi:Nucleoid occlusion protein [Firmicutes bacterium ASF500]|nr:Nucleoid occlusion protein [Firmicutes bacterium ASF500]